MVIRGNRGVYFGNLDRMIFACNARGEIDFYSAENPGYPVMIHRAESEKEAADLIDTLLDAVWRKKANLFDFREP